MTSLLDTIKLEAQGKNTFKVKDLMNQFGIDHFIELPLGELDNFYAKLKQLPAKVNIVGEKSYTSPAKPRKSMHAPVSSVSMNQTVLLVEQKVEEAERDFQTVKDIHETCLRDLAASVRHVEESKQGLESIRAELEQLYYQFPETRKQVENFLNH